MIRLDLQLKRILGIERKDIHDFSPDQTLVIEAVGHIHIIQRIRLHERHCMIHGKSRWSVFS